MNKPNLELLELFTAAQDGSLDAAGLARLEQLISGDDQAMSDYLQLMTMHAAMKRSRQPRPRNAAAPQPEVIATIQPNRWAIRAIAAVMIVGLAVGITAISSLWTAPALAHREGSWVFATLENGAANLCRTDNLVWESMDPPRKARTPLKAGGTLKFAAGAAFLDLFTGPEVIVEGPATFTLAHDGGFLQSGKLTLRSLDPSHRFSLVTPTAQITGSAAEVGLVVNDEGVTDVYILEGSAEARLRPDAGESRRVALTAGQTCRLDGNEVVGLRAFGAAPVRHDWATDQGLHTAPAHVTNRPLDITFNAAELKPYDDQDGLFHQPTLAAVLDGGRTLKLNGNCWKRIDLDYTVTPSTVLEFEFMSTSQGELHGIGFDSDNSHQTGRTIFQVFGYDTLIDGIYAFRGYQQPGWQRYRIPVGRFYTGVMRNLLFFADDDARGQAESVFRNVRILEESTTILR
jgi:ferric-dicitrate binding protein FerR (iron transport regulator)